MKYVGDYGGVWKATQNEITETLPGGKKRIRFMPVAAHLTEAAMRKLHGRYADVERAGEVDHLLLIPLLCAGLPLHPSLHGWQRSNGSFVGVTGALSPWV